MLNEWTVLLNGKQYIEDIRRASGDMLSGTLPTCEVRTHYFPSFFLIFFCE